MSRQLFEDARKVLTQEAAVKLDPVGQEDKDVDNDGDADKTDSYLKKRRGAISAAIAKSKNESALSDEDIAKLKSILGEQGVAEGSLKEVSLDLAKRARDKAEHMVDMDYDDLRAQPYGYSEKQRKKFQRYIDKKEPRAKGDRDWSPPERGVAEGAIEDAEAAKKKMNTPAVQRKAQGGDWKLTQQDLQKMPAATRTTSQGLAAHAKRIGMGEETDLEEAKLSPEGKAAVKDVSKKIGAKKLSQTKALVSLAKMNPKNVKEDAEQTDEAMSHQAKTTMKHVTNPTAGEKQAAKDIKPGVAGYRDRIAMLKSAEARGGLKKEDVDQEDFELIEKLNFEVPENPSYKDYFKAALTIAQCESFSELSEEDQLYIMNEMETAFKENDISFIIESEAFADMNDTVQRLRKAGHKVEDMGKDYRGNPYYIYVDKGSMMRRKVTYRGGQKVTQNMGKAQPEKEEDNQ